MKGPEFFRITDLELVREILSRPEIYGAMGDDFTPPVEEFTVNDHPLIWYVGIRNEDRLIGMFVLIPENPVCWQVHVAMMPWATTTEKWAAARKLPGWLDQNSECRRLVAAVPACNRTAKVYGVFGLGMRYVGRHQAAFMKGGRLQDLIILGRPIGV